MKLSNIISILFWFVRIVSVSSYASTTATHSIESRLWAKKCIINLNFSPQNIRKLQKALIKFVDRQKIDASKIFNISIIELYDNYVSQKIESQELSTEFSSYENSL